MQNGYRGLFGLTREKCCLGGHDGKMKICAPGSIFISSQVVNPLAAWKGRITCVEITDRGFKFLREHPYHNGEVFVLDQGKLDESFWIEAICEPTPFPTMEFRALRFPGGQLPDWETLSIPPPVIRENWETVKVTITPLS